MLFSSNNGCGCFGGDDTILWFIILFLLIFCGDSVGGRNNGNGCGCNECC